MGSLQTRVSKLEQQRNAARGRRGWFDLEVWKAESAAGVGLDEQERRRLVEYPEFSGEIRANFARRRRRLESVAAMEDIPAYAEKFW